MFNQIGFIIKVFIVSAIVSVAIVYVGPMLAIAPTQFNALFAIIIPIPILVVALLWRGREKDKLTN